uniref:Uncharacterized protein MANES_15G192700 n=1 Tax=Rhizophora mucronata TaxID=61149 RepID=A0A2P2MUJ0_RHIMU
MLFNTHALVTVFMPNETTNMGLNVISWQGCSAFLILIFGTMMMAVMKRKAKIISEETFGRRHQHNLSVDFSPCLCPVDSLMDREMSQAIILLFQTIWSRDKYRNFFYLAAKALEPALFLSRQNFFMEKVYIRGTAGY